MIGPSLNAVLCVPDGIIVMNQPLEPLGINISTSSLVRIQVQMEVLMSCRKNYSKYQNEEILSFLILKTIIRGFKQAYEVHATKDSKCIWLTLKDNKIHIQNCSDSYRSIPFTTVSNYTNSLLPYLGSWFYVNHNTISCLQ
jgi:hypothetical protein